MTIRGIDAYLRERKLSTTAPLSALSGTRLGIDAHVYLRALLSDGEAREPLVASTGGLPLALTTRIEADLRALERLGVKPVFVFPGLPFAPRPTRATAANERENAAKNDAWAHYEDGNVERAVVALTQVRGGAWVDVADVMRVVLRLFKHRLVEYIIAPYLASAQLAYLVKHPRGYVHAIYSDSEALLFSVDKVITSLDFTASSMVFVDKARLLGDLQLTADQFLDLSLLAGCSLSRTFPVIANDFALRAVIDLLRQFKAGIALAQAWREHPALKGSGYVEAYMRARLAVKHALVLGTEGQCVPLPLVVPPPGERITVADVPSDMDDIYSLRLPDELYFLICRGMVAPQLVGWLTSGFVDEKQPLADSGEYRRFIKDVITEGPTSPRCTTLALLVASLHPQWMQRRVAAHYYFDPPFGPASGDTIPFTDPTSQSLVEKCRSWNVGHAVIADELRRQSSSTIDLKLCINTLDKEESAVRTRVRDKREPTMDKKDQIVANVIWRFLDARGFVTNTHQQSLIGKALAASTLSSRVTDKLQESLFLVLELLRAGVVHGAGFGPADAPVFSGGPSYGSDDERRSCLLIMRVLSVVPLTFRPEQWSGPLSRELLVFNSFVRSTIKSLRYLLEAINVHLLLSGDARRSRDDHLDLCISLPFQQDVNTGFGILAKSYLDATIFHYDDVITPADAGSPRAQEAKKAALEFVEQAFTGVKGPTAEVERGFRFWDAVMVAVRTLDKEQGPSPSIANTVVQRAILEQFEAADAWLRPMRP
ncbi:COP9 signalosome complex subunit 5 [Cryptotrichosporon argae]